MQKKPTRPIQKRSFLLFELLVALALVTLCLFPLLKPHFGIQKEQIKEVEMLQLQRFANEAFCKIKEKLYTDESLNWNYFSKTQSGTLKETMPVYLGKDKMRHYQPHYSIEKIKKAPKVEGALLLKVDIYFVANPHREVGPFSHTLVVKRVDRA